MRLEEVLVRRLAAEIDAELANLDALEREFANRPQHDDSYSLRARGSILHDLYAGIERILVRIAHELNGGVPQAEQWHQQLIEDMRLDIPEVRPAVIDSALARTLGEYLRCRHVFRNVYGSTLEVGRLRPLEQRLPVTLAAFREQIRAFLSWMLADGQEKQAKCVPSPPGWTVRTSA